VQSSITPGFSFDLELTSGSGGILMGSDRRQFLQATIGVAAVRPEFRTAAGTDDAPCAIVVGPRADRLETKAALELQRYFQLLFGFSPPVLTALPKSAQGLILVGNPESNPAIREAAADSWPRLTDQGFVLRKVTCANMPALVAGGGSPIATLWAAYDLLEHYGVRYLFRGDFVPEERQAFSLPPLDTTKEPSLTFRCWRVWNAHACGPESWGIEEQKRIIDQLVKKKFNVVMVNLWSTQPFVPYEFRGVKKSTGDLFWGWKYPLDCTTIGKEKFGEASEFINPDFQGATTYDERLAAGQKLMHGILSYAHGYAMKTVVAFGLIDVPQEFKEHFKDWLPSGRPATKSAQSFFICEGIYTHGVNPEGEAFLNVDNPALMELVETVVKAHIDTYPEADYYQVGPPELRSPVGGYERLWMALDSKYHLQQIEPLSDMLAKAERREFYDKGRARRELESDVQFLYFLDKLLNERRVLEKTRRPDAKLIIESLSEELNPVLPRALPSGAGYVSFVDYTMSRVARRTEVLVSLKGLWTLQIMTLQDDNASMLSQMVGRSTQSVLQALNQYGVQGYYVRFWMPNETEAASYILSRGSWERSLTAEQGYRDLLTPMCGKGTADAIAAFGKIEDATAWGDSHGMVSGGFPVVDCLMRFFEARQPASANLEGSIGQYRQALPVLLRARDAATGQGRGFLDYYVGRLQCTIAFLRTCQKAGELGDAYKKWGELEKAKRIEATLAQRGEVLRLAAELEAQARSSVEALAGVASDQSDRGMLAIMNRYVYQYARALNLRLDLELSSWRIE
jgi:hypothetical protein